MFWKALFLTTVATLGHLAVTEACSPTDDPNDASMDSVEVHLERLCLSDLVFRGRITNTETTEDDEFFYVTTTFRVLEYLRDTSEENSLNLDVTIEYPKDMLCCTLEPFDTTQDTILVYAFSFGGGLGFALPCEGYPPFEAVPAAFFEAVENDNPCGDGGFIGGPVEQPDGAPPTVSTTNDPSTAAAYTSLPMLSIFPFNTEVQCPEDGQHDIVVDAQVDLTGVDPSSISYTVDFDFSTETCQVDLTICSGSSADLCYCVQQSDTVYTVRLDMTADQRYSDVEVKITIPNSNLTSIVATSNSSNYPEILGEITQSLRTDNQVFYLDAVFQLLDISQETDKANLWYEVSGLNSPYQIMIQPIPNGPTFVSNNGPLTATAVDLNYTGLILSYQELEGPCARNYSKTYTFSAAASVMNASLVTLTPFIGFAILIFSRRWTN